MTTAYHHHYQQQHHHHYYQRSSNNDNNNNNASSTMDAFKLLQQKNNERNNSATKTAAALQNLLFADTSNNTDESTNSKTKTTTNEASRRVIVKADDVRLHCVRKQTVLPVISPDIQSHIHNNHNSNQKQEENQSQHQRSRSSPVDINNNKKSCGINSSSLNRSLRHSLTRQSCTDYSTPRNTNTNNKKGLTRQSLSFDSATTTPAATINFHQDKSLNYLERRHSLLLTSKPTRLRKSSSILRDIIIESVSETTTNNTMGENTTAQHNNNNNATPYKNGIVINTSSSEMSQISPSTTPKKTASSTKKAGGYVRDPKKVYRHRKHHSDYGIVFLQVDDSFDHSSDDSSSKSEAESTTPISHHRSRTMSYSSTDDHEDQILNGGGLKVNDTSKLHSKSDSNLDESGLFNRPCSRSPKSNSHVDITSTQMYKDIYADNLRQYGFLLAKVSISFIFLI